MKKIGFSNFVDVRPKNCILVEGSGTHSVCVCTMHQNIKLMMIGVKMTMLTALSVTPISTYHDCLTRITRKESTSECYVYVCSCVSCPGVVIFRYYLTTIMEDSMIDTIVFKQWISVDTIVFNP